MGILQISALSAMTRIGVHAWEQRIQQQLLIDIRIPLNIAECNNELANTINYDELCQCVTAYIETTSFSLIETVAEQVAQLIKTKFLVKELTLSISKPKAIKNAGNVTITITR